MTGCLSPVDAVVRGALAGAAGTGAMDALLFLRYRRDGGEIPFGDWELSSGVTSWDQAPAPAHVGKRLFEGLLQRQIPETRAALVNNITHWGYGIAAGAQYGVIAGSRAHRRVRWGLPFGAAVWASGYVVLPLARLYEPIWKYDRRTLGRDLSAHLVYGIGTAGTLRLLTR